MPVEDVGAPIVVRVSPLDRRRGILRLCPLALPCALGRSGTTAHKREGDGATPIGDHAILHGYINRDRWPMPPRAALLLRSVRPSDGWCDATGDARYNRPVALPYPASAETMVRGDRLYDAVLVLDYNVRTRVQGRGSAIFFHVAKPGYPPTEGCIAVSPQHMRLLLPHLRRGRTVRVV